ncbi:MAG: hypothetical protein Phog2KO_49480 [Phototrophicaceae bacterium]
MELKKKAELAIYVSFFLQEEERVSTPKKGGRYLSTIMTMHKWVDIYIVAQSMLSRND